MRLGMGRRVGECRAFSNRSRLRDRVTEFKGEFFRVTPRLAAKNLGLLQHAIVEFLLAPVGGGLHEGQHNGMRIFLGG